MTAAVQKPPRRRFAGLAVVAAGLAATALSPSGMRLAHADSPPIAFGTPTVVDPVNLFGEPDIRFDPSNPTVAYASGPWGTGTQRSIWDKSPDGGHTFRELHNMPGDDPLHTGGSLHGPGGGDTEIAVDRTGKLYGADLAALVTQDVFTSTDGGQTFQTQPLAPAFQDPNGSGTDRQWFGLWDPPDPAAARAASGYTGAFPVNYMVYLAAVGANCPSTCELVTSSVPAPNGDSSRVGLDYACGAGQQGTAGCPTWQLNGDGYVFLDQLTGKVVQAMDVADPNNPNNHAAGVEVVSPGQDGYMDPKSAKTEYIPTDLGAHSAFTQTIFPVIAEDAQRNAYYIWVERPLDATGPRLPTSWQVFYSWSPPGVNNDWSQWSPPVQVTFPNDAATSATAIMPWAVAGGNGNLDIVWYGTTSLLKNPEDESQSDTAGASWFLWFANVRNAATGSPSITTMPAVDHPMHHGSICLEGLNCITIQGNRNLADFFEVVPDATGAATIVYDNTANDLIQELPGNGPTVPEGVVDHKGAELVHVVHQISGPGLNGDGTLVSSPDDHGVDSITAAPGNALYPPVDGTEQQGLDVTGVSIASKDATTLEATITLADPTDIARSVGRVGAAVADLTVRWEYRSNLYFATVEVPSGGAPATAFDGASQSVDLCSVSACDPHVLTYPGPAVAPSTSHLISPTFALPGSGPIVVDIPRADVGGPKDGEVLDSVGAYAFVALHSANQPMTNAEAFGNLVPIEVGGACCFTPVLGGPSAVVPESRSVAALGVAGLAGLCLVAVRRRHRPRAQGGRRLIHH